MVISDEYYKKHAPEMKRYLKASKTQKKKHPQLLYLVQYGDNEPTMVFAPDETREERIARLSERKAKKELRTLVKKTKAEIKEGKQGKMSDYLKCFERKPN